MNGQIVKKAFKAPCTYYNNEILLCVFTFSHNPILIVVIRIIRRKSRRRIRGENISRNSIMLILRRLILLLKRIEIKIVV